MVCKTVFSVQAYLSGLSKTSKVKTVQKADFAWDKFGDVSDPSVSEDEPVKKSPSSGFGTAGSKFLKKKQPDQNQEVVGKKSEYRQILYFVSIPRLSPY